MEEEKEWRRVCLGPVRILLDDLPSVTTDGEGDTW